MKSAIDPFFMWSVVFWHVQGQLNLAFPITDLEWHWNRGTEYHFAVDLIDKQWNARMENDK